MNINEAQEQLMTEALAGLDGDYLILRVAHRQGFAGRSWIAAAHYLASRGITFTDVCRISS